MEGDTDSNCPTFYFSVRILSMKFVLYSTHQKKIVPLACSLLAANNTWLQRVTGTGVIHIFESTAHYRVKYRGNSKWDTDKQRKIEGYIFSVTSGGTQTALVSLFWILRYASERFLQWMEFCFCCSQDWKMTLNNSTGASLFRNNALDILDNSEPLLWTYPE